MELTAGDAVRFGSGREGTFPSGTEVKVKGTFGLDVEHGWVTFDYNNSEWFIRADRLEKIEADI